LENHVFIFRGTQESEEEETEAFLNVYSTSIVVSYYPGSLEFSSVCWCFNMEEAGLGRGRTNGTLQTMHAIITVWTRRKKRPPI